MTKTFKPLVRKTTTIEETYQLTRGQIIEMIRQQLGVDETFEVNFDYSDEFHDDETELIGAQVTRCRTNNEIDV